MKLPNRVIEGSADGTISRTCCTPQLRERGPPVGQGHLAFRGRRETLHAVGHHPIRGWPFAAKPDTSRARDDGDRGVHEAALYRDPRVLGGESGQLLANVLKRSEYARRARDQYAWMRTPWAESRAWLAF